MKRPTRIGAIALLGGLALVALLAYGLSSNAPDRGIERALDRGERVAAPEIELPRLSGNGTGSLADYRGEVVVLNVWTSWCEPCRDESPLLQRWHERMEAAGGTVLGIDVFDVSSDARAFVREYGLTYPILRDHDGDSMDALGAITYPETFVVDRRGRIVAARRGPVDEGWMRGVVAPLLERS